MVVVVVVVVVVVAPFRLTSGGLREGEVKLDPLPSPPLHHSLSLSARVSLSLPWRRPNICRVSVRTYYISFLSHQPALFCTSLHFTSLLCSPCHTRAFIALPGAPPQYLIYFHPIQSLTWATSFQFQHKDRSRTACPCSNTDFRRDTK